MGRRSGGGGARAGADLGHGCCILLVAAEKSHAGEDEEKKLTARRGVGCPSGRILEGNAAHQPYLATNTTTLLCAEKFQMEGGVLNDLSAMGDYLRSIHRPGTDHPRSSTRWISLSPRSRHHRLGS